MEKTFSEIIRKARSDKALTVKEFIEQLKQLGADLSPSYITKIEVHGEIPQPDLVCKIAEILNLDQLTLLEAAKENKIRSYEQVLEKKYETAVKLYRLQRGNNAP